MQLYLREIVATSPDFSGLKSWEFPNLVVSHLSLVFNFDAFLGPLTLRSFTPLKCARFCVLAFALLSAHLHSFALFCVFLRPTASRTTALGNFRFKSGCAMANLMFRLAKFDCRLDSTTQLLAILEENQNHNR